MTGYWRTQYSHDTELSLHRLVTGYKRNVCLFSGCCGVMSPQEYMWEYVSIFRVWVWLVFQFYWKCLDFYAWNRNCALAFTLLKNILALFFQLLNKFFRDPFPEEFLVLFRNWVNDSNPSVSKLSLQKIATMAPVINQVCVCVICVCQHHPDDSLRLDVAQYPYWCFITRGSGLTRRNVLSQFSGFIT